MQFVVVAMSYVLACLASNRWGFSEALERPSIVTRREFEERLKAYQSRFDALRRSIRGSSDCVRAKITKEFEDRVDTHRYADIICPYLRDSGALLEGTQMLSDAMIGSFVALCLGDDSEMKPADGLLERLVGRLCRDTRLPAQWISSERLSIGRIIAMDEFVKIIHDAADQANNWLLGKINWRKAGGRDSPYMREIEFLDGVKLARFDLAARQRKYATGRDLDLLRRLFPALFLAKDQDERWAVSCMLRKRPSILLFGDSFYDYAGVASGCSPQFRWAMSACLDQSLVERMNYSTDVQRKSESAFPMLRETASPVRCYVELKHKLSQALVRAGALDLEHAQAARDFDLALMEVIRRVGERCRMEPIARGMPPCLGNLSVKEKAQRGVLEFFSIFAVRFDEMVAVAVGGSCSCGNVSLGCTSTAAKGNPGVSGRAGRPMQILRLAPAINSQLRALSAQLVRRSCEILESYNAVIKDAANGNTDYSFSSTSGASTGTDGACADQLLSDIKVRSEAIIVDLGALCGIVDDAMNKMSVCDRAQSATGTDACVWLSDCASCEICKSLPLMYAYGFNSSRYYPACPSELTDKFARVLTELKCDLEKYADGLQKRKEEPRLSTFSSRENSKKALNEGCPVM
ncbi:hypothetical protein PAPHI01_0411 [Pancytospora philotis]|nr:hypothetical protein PAPHI01_0411 [Pancytospora philotis]